MGDATVHGVFCCMSCCIGCCRKEEPELDPQRRKEIWDRHIQRRAAADPQNAAEA